MIFSEERREHRIWQNGAGKGWLISDILAFAILFFIFYFSAYISVSSHLPTSVPVHHDDYTNYAAGGAPFSLSWVRPLSSFIIHFLAKAGPEWLIWSVRLLTVFFVLLSWKLLCLLHRPKYYFVVLVLFGVAVFSTPIVVEYARYTGMITHLLSGCFGLMAVLFLFGQAKYPGRRYMPLSIFFLVLSALAKEDFIFFYATSLAYVALFFRTERRKIAVWGVVGLLFCVILVASAKILSQSSFLGVSDQTSTYYIDVSPMSVAKTVIHLLTGASHPAMFMHGWVVFGAFCFSSLVALFFLLERKTIVNAGYFIVAVLSIIAPYSVLPNHANAYYEMVWVPMIFAAVFAASIDLQKMSDAKVIISTNGNLLATIVLFVFATFLSIVDFSGRKGIAAWYDNIAVENSKMIDQLYSLRGQINQAKYVCVEGANAFSPWYMHGGQYLRSVMSLYAIWHIVDDPGSSTYAGMQTGAGLSDKRSVVISREQNSHDPCLHIDLAGAS